jgi:hypothetical protein
VRDLLAHRLGIAPGRLERRAVLGGEGDPAELPQKLAHAPLMLGLDMPAQPRRERLPGLARIVADAGPRVPSERVAHEAIRGAGGQGITVTEEELERRVLVLQAPQELVPQPGLSRPRGPEDQGRLRRGVLHRPGHEALELGELEIAADAGGGLAEQEPALVCVRLLAQKEGAAALGHDAEMSAQEPCRHAVEPDAPRGVLPRAAGLDRASPQSHENHANEALPSRPARARFPWAPVNTFRATTLAPFRDRRSPPR